MTSPVLIERARDPNDPLFEKGRFDDIALFLTALGLNSIVAGRSVVVTPLDPHHKCRWQAVVLRGNYRVLEQDRRGAYGPSPLKGEPDYTTMRSDSLLDREGALLLGSAHPQDVAESFVRHLASRIYLRGPLIL